VARQNVLRFDRCYDRDAGFWEPETRTPTRLEERPQVTLRLALVRDGAVVPYVPDDDPRHAWSLSEVTIARHRVSACPPPPGLEVAVDRARQAWGRWERESTQILLAVMVEAEDGGFSIQAMVESGQRVLIGYDRNRGLIFPVPTETE
jgi:CRISPR-associated endonuclease/helicase Cas3